MRKGNWVPISKALVSYLPKTRPYSEVEAAISLQVDYDRNSTVTIAGYSNLWGWSRGKVSRFLERMGAKILYPEVTTKKQNQRGQIVIQIATIKRSDKEQIRLIDSKDIDTETDRKRLDNKQKTDRSQLTTIDPNPNPDNIEDSKLSSGGNGSRPPTCPHQKIIDQYHKTLPELPRIIEWDETAKQWLRARWRSKPERSCLEFWETFFNYIRKSRFLLNGKDQWIPDLRWIVKSSNFTKIINGNYHNNQTFNAAARWLNAKQRPEEIR